MTTLRELEQRAALDELAVAIADYCLGGEQWRGGVAAAARRFVGARRSEE